MRTLWQTNTQLFTGWMPFLSPNQKHQSVERIILFNSVCLLAWCLTALSAQAIAL